MTKTYVAEARRFGSWWAIDVPAVPGVHTQARRLTDVAPMARDAIAGVLDLPLRLVKVEVRPLLDGQLADIVRRAREARLTAQEAQLEAGRLSAQALRALERAEVPLRDAGELLGMSHQRAAQIMSTDRRAYERQRRKAIAELRAGYDLRGEKLPRREDEATARALEAGREGARRYRKALRRLAQ